MVLILQTQIFMGLYEDFSARSGDFSHQNDLTPGFSDILLGLV